MDAFDELAPPASPSASKPMKRPHFYHVFINHRGQDVKSTIATIIYGLLTQCHLSVFLDEPELENGDFFPETLQAAMSSALVHIAIFSERYAESPWCLAELSYMVKSGAPIIPIFYHVDPTDLRRVHQGKGKYVDAFDKYVKKNRYLGKLNEWKKALHKASFYKGEVIINKEVFRGHHQHREQLRDHQHRGRQCTSHRENQLWI